MRRGLEVIGLHAGHGTVEALHGLTLHFPLGTLTGVLGRNGAGKSTLVQAIAGTVPVTSGSIRWRGVEITSMSPHRRVAAGLMVVPDDRNVFFELTVEEHLSLSGGGVAPDGMYALFPELGRVAGRRVSSLSGGERQMVALARLLLRPGDCVLLDEASRGLAPSAVDRLYRALTDLVSPQRTVIVVEQYQSEILRRADIVYVISRGELAWAGEHNELIGGRLPTVAMTESGFVGDVRHVVTDRLIAGRHGLPSTGSVTDAVGPAGDEQTVA